MTELRPGAERGHANHGWLDSYHSFSFADYYDPTHMGFGPLRIINEDWINPGMGFGMHGHRDMEIITYVLEGELAHRDSMGNGSVIRPGNVQRMSAGSGVRHSEFNHSQEDTVHLLQIWIEPNVKGIQPEYEEKHFDTAEKRGGLRRIASPDGEEGAVKIHQDAKIYAGLFDGEESASLSLRQGRRFYLHVARGEIVANGQALRAGDALKLEDETGIELMQGKAAEVLLFDLP
jgi:quercetin 2,3-dioxygenase